MKDLRRAGGFAALTAAATVIIGLGMFATALSDYTTGDLDTTEALAYVVDHQTTMYVWNFITLIVFGLALVFVALALHERMKPDAEPVMRLATGFGLVWSGLLVAGGMVSNVGMSQVVELATTTPDRAASAWIAIESVGNALSGQIEIVGALWILLVSSAALRTRAFPRQLGYLGFVMAVSAFATVIPAFEMVAVVFGLGLIVWFGWVGLILLRSNAAGARGVATGSTSARTLEDVSSR